MGRRLAALAALAVAAGGASSAGAQVGARFGCVVRASSSAGPNGMESTPFDLREVADSARFTFDESTGEFLWPDLPLRIRYDVRQRGSTVNGIVAVAMVQGPMSYSAKVLRIASWAPVTRGGRRLYPFMLLDEDRVQTGECEMLV